MKNKLFKILTISSLALVISMPASYAASEKLSGKASNFTLKSRSGKNIKLSDMRGKVVMLNFCAANGAPAHRGTGR